MTNWTERDLSIDLTPLKLQSSEAVVFSDGINAKRGCHRLQVHESAPVFR